MLKTNGIVLGMTIPNIIRLPQKIPTTKLTIVLNILSPFSILRRFELPTNCLEGNCSSPVELQNQNKGKVNYYLTSSSKN